MVFNIEMIGSIMNDELESMLKEVFVACFKVYPGIRVQELKKTRKNPRIVACGLRFKLRTS
jgi:hypothetical protein